MSGSGTEVAGATPSSTVTRIALIGQLLNGRERQGWAGSCPLLVMDELIDIGYSRIRAHSISTNNSSIHLFTKSGHEPIYQTINTFRYSLAVLCLGNVPYCPKMIQN